MLNSCVSNVAVVNIDAGFKAGYLASLVARRVGKGEVIMINVSASPLPQLVPRASESHKGDYGRVLLIGGCRGMSGALALAGKAALRSGAGPVTFQIGI